MAHAPLRLLHSTAAPLSAPAPAFAVFVLDASGLIAGWSPSAAGLTGYTGAEMVGKELAVLFPPEARALEHPDRELAIAARSGRLEDSGWFLQKGGERIWIELVVTALRGEGGFITGFACQARDLTAFKLAESQRVSRAEKLSRLALVTDDVAGVAPDISLLLPRVAARARELTGADAAVVELRDGVGGRGRAHNGLASLDVRLGALLMPYGESTDRFAPQCLRYDDHHESPEILGDVCDRSGVGSVLAIPIVHERQTIGWLAALSQSSTAFDDQDASTIELMATLLGSPVAAAQAAEAHRSLIAERTRAQAAHRESEERFHAAMDASLDALFILSAVRDQHDEVIAFTLLDANRRAEELCGIEHEAFANRSLDEMHSVRRQLAPLHELAAVVRSREPVEQERRALDVNGAPRWIHEQIVPLGDGVTVTVRDITARKKAEEEVRRAWAAAEAANQAKTDFVARMSHELRTPLNSVIGFANVLLRNKRNALEETELAYLNRVKNAGTHLLALINDVLDIAKVEAGRMTLELTSVDIVGTARNVLQQLDSHSAASGLLLRLDAPPEPLFVLADAGKLHQVLLNIIGNAIKFTPAGSVTVRIVTSVASDGSVTPQCIEVVDTGIGIPPERLNAVFDAFEQAESSTSRRYGGTGLGLSISRALCEAMGFALEVESELGFGTTFRIVLPS
ncbi:MAG: domain S-box protein [Gemmatimonadetes bacterium]|nr:domain S-box protein [Gemmatimonadota bacterium]